MKKNLFILIAGLIVFAQCTEKDEPKPVTNIDINPKSLAVIEADNAFGLKMFQEINGLPDSDTNLFVSPTSVGLALAMAYNGARNETKEAFEECMQLSGFTTQEINEVYQNLMQGLIGADPDVTFTVANSIWYEQSFDVFPDFLNTNIQYYNAEVSPLDFSDPASVDVINNWVATNTNDRITEIIDNISPTQLMFLINAIYFKGTWQYEFDPANTTDMAFYRTPTNPVDVPTMHMEADLETLSTGMFRAVKLPYGNGSYSMIIMLPTAPTTVDELIASLTIENWTEWQSSFSVTEDMELFLPKFKFEYNIDLMPILDEMGLGNAFTPNADFTGISNLRPLYIGKVKHKTFVDVNEEGTEAAAVTLVGFTYTSVNPNLLAINKPFVFSICEETTGAIVFIGKVVMPEY
ncbi:MAG: serpin family protein [Bacteroidota bacterium]|nr:serpin family protein [Bacteroidota bacterium]